MRKEPRFRVDRVSVPPRVYLQCSNCEKDLREIQPNESIRITRAYYCEDCDDGAIHLNQPCNKEEDQL